ncbi:MAG: hypothetical protein WC825_02325 [Gallionellaceae bacterium]|jgi:hypothetical protein
MAQPVSNKVHTHIGHPRSLCGLAPKNGAHYRIVDFPNFFTAPEENQCGKCLENIRRRGYNIAALRRQHRTQYEVHQQLAA